MAPAAYWVGWTTMSSYCLLVAMFLCQITLGAEVIVDWSRGNITLSNLTAEDTLIFIYTSEHNVVLAFSEEEFETCAPGVEICEFSASPCPFPLTNLDGALLLFFSQPQCASGFKSRFQIGEESTPSPTSPVTSSPSQSPIIVTNPPNTPSPTLAPTSTLPTASPSQSPIIVTNPPNTPSPTLAPTSTLLPTSSPTTSRPTTSPTSQPTQSPTTSTPTASPTTSIPTGSPTASAPSTSPTTSQPTSSPTTSRPSSSPTTSQPTVSPTPNPTTTQPSSSPSVTTTLPPSVPATLVPTRSPSLPTSAPSSSPTATSAPSQSPTLGTAVPTAPPVLGVTSSPTKRPTTSSPTKRPTTLAPTKTPTLRPTRMPTFEVAEEEGKLMLFIQLDHSGSIREANPLCRRQSEGKRCWEIIVEFVENLVNTLVVRVGGYQNFRLHLSYFSCTSKTNRPINKIIAQLADTAAEVQKALATLKTLDEDKMYGTCPSLGASEMLKMMQRYNNVASPWPMAYYIVTDGRVTGADRKDYRRVMLGVRNEVRKRVLTRDVCAMTIGEVGIKEDLKSLIRSDCVESVNEFVGMRQLSLAMHVADLLLPPPGATPAPSVEEEDDYTPIVDDGVIVVGEGGDDDDDSTGNDDDESPSEPPTTSSPLSSSNTGPAGSSPAGVAIGILSGIGLVGGVMFVGYRRRQQQQQEQQQQSHQWSLGAHLPALFNFRSREIPTATPVREDDGKLVVSTSAPMV